VLSSLLLSYKADSVDSCIPEHGEKLLVFLQRKYPGLSVRRIKEGISHHSCTVNGRIELFPSRRLVREDLVIYTEPTLSLMQQSILYEDDYLVCIDKPAGLLSSPAALTSLFGNRANVWKFVHRLDKETSGVLLLAKGVEMQKTLEDLFRKKTIDKEYLAIVQGVIRQKQGVIHTFLTPKKMYQGQTLYESAKEGRQAITKWRLLSIAKGVSLVLCTPITGRTHQIRVHMSEMEHPVLGDSLYGGKASPLSCTRHLLHAHVLRFVHPVLHNAMEITAPLPEDFLQAFIKLQLSYR